MNRADCWTISKPVGSIRDTSRIVRMWRCYELLERHPFPEALLHLARGLRRLAVGAGRPEVYHETITAAFLALIAERRLRDQYAGWEDFAERNPDLLEKECLRSWYEPELLHSAIARRTFVLPRPGGDPVFRERRAGP